MVKLNSFVKTTKNRNRVARGVSSGYGRTAGRGHKGYKARSGSSVRGFEGGQTPIYRRLPMRGFVCIKPDVHSLSVRSILALMSEVEEINKDTLFKYRFIGNLDKKVKLIGSDVEIKDAKCKKITVDNASKNVVEVLKKSGIEVVINS